jgi:hypothetical protein
VRILFGVSFCAVEVHLYVEALPADTHWESAGIEDAKSIHDRHSFLDTHAGEKALSAADAQAKYFDLHFIPLGLRVK